ncbi:MAG: hypothetical protein NZ869_07825 [Thermoanaerobaculum sp.]|nr:hypothetical protein [Thermoanaerobaculum sp.]
MAGDKKENRSLEVQNLRHHEATPPNNPPAGVAPTFEVRPRERQRYEDDPHLDPQLAWAGKGKPTSFAVEVVSLHIHERIASRAIVRMLRRHNPLTAVWAKQ